MQGQISAGGLIVGGMIGQRGAPGNGIASIVKTGESGLVDTYTITYTNGTTDTIQVTNGAKGDKGDKGDQGIQGIQGVKGDKGDKGDTGEQGMQGIQGERGEKGEQGERGERGYQGVTGEKGDKGDKGDTGAKGDTGETGNGISSIEKTSTTGNIDTYTITFTNGTTTTFEVTNGANGSVTDVQVEGTSVVDNGVANIVGLATQEELDYYKTIYNVLPKVEGNGESITLNDTGESILKLDLKGNTSQYSTTGYALYDFMNNTYTKEGNLVVTKLDNGYAITSNDSIEARIIFNNVSVDSSKNYVISFDLINTSGSRVRVGWVGSSKIIATYSVSGKLAQSFTGITTSAFSIYVEAGKTITITNLMIYEGTDLTKEYEPYTEGIPAPNPSYPYLIHEVSGDNEINVTGKNLFDKDSQDILENVRIGTDGGNNADSGYFISEFIEVTPNTKYTKNTTADAYHRFAFYTDKSTNSFISKSEDNTITTPSNAKYLRICGLITEKGSIQIEKSSTAGTYQPYSKDTYELDLGTIKMRGIGTYEDYFVRNSEGQWCKYNAIGNVVLDGSEEYSYSAGYKNTLLKNIGMIATNVQLTGFLYCNYFTEKGNTEADNFDYAISRFYATSSYNYEKLVFKDKNMTSANDFKTWLSTHNTEVDYVLASPYLSLIESETLQSQLDAIEKALGKDGQTNISQINNDAPFKIYASALMKISGE